MRIIMPSIMDRVGWAGMKLDLAAPGLDWASGRARPPSGPRGGGCIERPLIICASFPSYVRRSALSASESTGPHPGPIMTQSVRTPGGGWWVGRFAVWLRKGAGLD